MAAFLSDLSPWVPAALLVLASLGIAIAGTRLAHVANVLADRTGMGEVMAGGLFVGAMTSIPDLVTSVSAAAQDRPGLAIGNALGGLTAQTAFLAVADLAYRRANLEHAAASTSALAQATLLMALLTLPMLAAQGPEVTFLAIHPASLVLPLCYLVGLRLLRNIRAEPMWSPVMTDATQAEEVEGQDRPAAPAEEDERSTPRLWTLFALYGLALGVAGYVVAESGIALVDATDLSETAVGTVFTALSSSLGELVTAIAAVRAGAVALAVGNVLGGNAFDVLLLALSDMAWREGSLYHAFTAQHHFTALTALLMTAVLLLGLLMRERRGPGGIGFESVLVLGLYAGSIVMVFT